MLRSSASRYLAVTLLGASFGFIGWPRPAAAEEIQHQGLPCNDLCQAWLGVDGTAKPRDAVGSGESGSLPQRRTIAAPVHKAGGQSQLKTAKKPPATEGKDAALPDTRSHAAVRTPLPPSRQAKAHVPSPPPRPTAGAIASSKLMQDKPAVKKQASAKRAVPSSAARKPETEIAAQPTAPSAPLIAAVPAAAPLTFATSAARSALPAPPPAPTVNSRQIGADHQDETGSTAPRVPTPGVGATARPAAAPVVTFSRPEHAASQTAEPTPTVSFAAPLLERPSASQQAAGTRPSPAPAIVSAEPKAAVTVQEAPPPVRTPTPPLPNPLVAALAPVPAKTDFDRTAGQNAAGPAEAKETRQPESDVTGADRHPVDLERSLSVTISGLTADPDGTLVQVTLFNRLRLETRNVAIDCSATDAQGMKVAEASTRVKQDQPTEVAYEQVLFPPSITTYDNTFDCKLHPTAPSSMVSKP